MYTRRFVTGHITTLEARALLWIVPEGYTWVMRDVVMWNPLGAEQTISLYLNEPSAGALLGLVARTVPAYATANVDLRQELLAGEQLHAGASAGDAWIAVTGYRFSL